VISKINGKLVAVSDTEATIAVEAFEYEVRICDFARRQLETRLGDKISLHTIQYLEGNPAQGKLTPRFVGFLSPVEREFFELFCSVDGVGVKKALRAMVRPVQEVAAMIESQDSKGMSTLPGIGAATSERIIAKLRRKMPKFALLVTTASGDETATPRDVIQDTYQVLMQLGHAEADARRLLDTALARKQKFKDVDSFIKAIYEQRNE